MNQQNEKLRQQNEQKWTEISGGSPKHVPSLEVFDYFMIIDDYLLFMIIVIIDDY